MCYAYKEFHLQNVLDNCYFRVNLGRIVIVGFEGEPIKSFLYDQGRKVVVDYGVKMRCPQESFMKKLLEPFAYKAVNSRVSFGLYYYLTNSSKGPPEIV